jgi:hypothetical protein
LDQLNGGWALHWAMGNEVEWFMLLVAFMLFRNSIEFVIIVIVKLGWVKIEIFKNNDINNT